MFVIGLKTIKQEKMLCGPASLKIVLDYYGKNISQIELKKLMNSSRIYGTNNSSMVKVSKELGFDVIQKTNSSVNEIQNLISKKIPPIIGWYTPENTSHYSVVCGIDKNSIHIIDPYLGEIRKFKINCFEKMWFDVNWEGISFFQKLFIFSKINLRNLIFKKKFNIKNISNEYLVFREIIIIKK